jgi:hypothetical protein
VTKLRLSIYSLILVILLFSLFICIFSLVENNKPNINNGEIAESTPPPITEIDWNEAVNLIQNCQIKTVFQKHNREVTLTDKNNRIFKTIEPKLDDVFTETNHLRSDCNDIIQTITE